MIQGTFSLDSKGVFQHGKLKPHNEKNGVLTGGGS